MFQTVKSNDDFPAVKRNVILRATHCRWLVIIVAKKTPRKLPTKGNADPSLVIAELRRPFGPPSGAPISIPYMEI